MRSFAGSGVLGWRAGQVDFDTFFAGSCAEMLARALVLAGSRHDAEDAVQDAYAEAWSRWDRISTYDNPWCVGVQGCAAAAVEGVQAVAAAEPAELC